MTQVSPVNAAKIQMYRIQYYVNLSCTFYYLKKKILAPIHGLIDLNFFFFASFVNFFFSPNFKNDWIIHYFIIYNFTHTGNAYDTENNRLIGVSVHTFCHMPDVITMFHLRFFIDHICRHRFKDSSSIALESFTSVDFSIYSK